jgi:hypothetical protein
LTAPALKDKDDSGSAGAAACAKALPAAAKDMANIKGVTIFFMRELLLIDMRLEPSSI